MLRSCRAEGPRSRHVAYAGTCLGPDQAHHPHLPQRCSYPRHGGHDVQEGHLRAGLCHLPSGYSLQPHVRRCLLGTLAVDATHVCEMISNLVRFSQYEVDKNILLAFFASSFELGC
ncbi:hypothetical protein RvY_12347 [Ramazzottius varieornatus]|uniref:Uncharacterized protein n=1 Tax=Ramazzottius varieornatus TaxID=947166 RepID=A0A1D1VJ75_RAMVA|nr:hypothetical protein RvY_12347 [Ramazzottius varieornatus]